MGSLNSDTPVMFYLDKKRAEVLTDIHAEYILKLQNLAMGEDLNTEEAFVYFDISLPLAALFELKKKNKIKEIIQRCLYFGKLKSTVLKN